MKRKLFAITAILMALVLTVPTAVFAANTDEPLNLRDMHRPSDIFDEMAEGHTNATFAAAEAWGMRVIVPTPAARDIALADFEYLFEKVMEVSPIRHLTPRVTGWSSFEAHFSVFHQMIYNSVPFLSQAEFILGESWAEELTDDRAIAADYLLSVLMEFTFGIGQLGHMASLDRATKENLFFGGMWNLQNGFLMPGELERALDAGYTMEQLDELLYPVLRFTQIHVEQFSHPSAMWLYGIDPSEFDLYQPLGENHGFENPYNVTTAIIEPGRIAYFHIACFLNNNELDAEIMHPFFEEVQDFEHLIIDVRGNLGGFPHSFTQNILAMLLYEPIYFEFVEFFIDSPLTAALFEYPSNMGGGQLQGRYAAYEFVQERGMEFFNPDDLAILDYALVWRNEFHPAQNGTPFGGNIWLLVDGMSASTSQLAAKIGISTDFATVVGEPASRITTPVYTHAVLPNTGILFRIDLGITVDSYGRAFEEFGVIPEIPNKQGMDALATVISIIAPELLEYFLPDAEEGR